MRILAIQMMLVQMVCVTCFAGNDPEKHDLIVAVDASNQLTITGFDPAKELAILPPVSGVLSG